MSRVVKSVVKRIHDLLLHFSDQQENADMVPDLHFLEKDKYAPLQRSKRVHPHSPWGQGSSAPGIDHGVPEFGTLRGTHQVCV